MPGRALQGIAGCSAPGKGIARYFVSERHGNLIGIAMSFRHHLFGYFRPGALHPATSCDVLRTSACDAVV